jgi:hypothetical protein
MSFLGPFEHTTGKTWGGTQITPGALQAASVLGGFFGLDHILLRSPKTAFFKLLVNMISFGFWYWYDVVQSFGDMESIKQYGYTIPLVGPVGLGAGIVGDTPQGAAPKDMPGPWTFVAYILLSLVPFGTASFLAGDFYGGAVKFFMTFFIFTTILGLLWTAYSAFYGIFKTETLLTHGVDRFFPATLFMTPYGPAPNLIPPKLKEAEQLQSMESGLFSWLYTVFIGPLEKPLLQAAVGVGEPLVQTAETLKQTGGGFMADALPSETSKYLFLTAAAAVCIGSLVVTYLRFWNAKKNAPSKHSEKNDIPPEGNQNDVPPGPRVL